MFYCLPQVFTAQPEPPHITAIRRLPASATRHHRCQRPAAATSSAPNASHCHPASSSSSAAAGRHRPATHASPTATADHYAAATSATTRYDAATDAGAAADTTADAAADATADASAANALRPTGIFARFSVIITIINNKL